MGSKRHIQIGIASDRAQGEEFAAMWKRAEQGLPLEEPVDRLYFESFPMLIKMLSPKRMELLKAIKTDGPITVRRLSHQLKRNYKNVHIDAAELNRLGLIQISDEKQLTVPWDVISISAEIPLLAKEA